MKFVEELEKELNTTLEKIGATEKASVVFSDRPEMSDFQSNIAFSLSKSLKKPPFVIASEISDMLKSKFFIAFAVNPGFINFKLSDEYFSEIFKNLFLDKRLGIEKEDRNKIVLDYGGPNVAKPLHVGHLRSAVIGESLKRLYRFMGNEVIADVHLGDWGLQMGLTIAGVLEKFDCSYYFNGRGLKPNFTEESLEEIYPKAAARAKEDDAFKKTAQEITVKLQAKEEGFYQIWQDIKEISVKSIKEIYKKLNVNFDRWYGESDAQPFVEDVFKILNTKNLIQKSQGAEIVVVDKDTDTSPMPPVIVRSTAGAELYATTELATIVSRISEFNPSKIIYLTDNRQGLHFKQVFRVCRLSGLGEKIEFVHIPFGTVNGQDGKPFKTREGGTMHLSSLIEKIEEACRDKIKQSNKIKDGTELNFLAKKISIAALKFGDLINFPAKDYVFDIPKFCSFEGKTGPYMQYCMVRINSILEKAEKFEFEFKINSSEEKNIIISLLKFSQDVKFSYLQNSPNIFVQSAFNLASDFSALYNKINILSEKNLERRNSLLTLISVIKKALEIFSDLIAIEIPEKM